MPRSKNQPRRMGLSREGGREEAEAGEMSPVPQGECQSTARLSSPPASEPGQCPGRDIAGDIPHL